MDFPSVFRYYFKIISIKYAATNKGITTLYGYRSPKTLLYPPVNGKIQGFSRQI